MGFVHRFAGTRVTLLARCCYLTTCCCQTNQTAVASPRDAQPAPLVSLQFFCVDVAASVLAFLDRTVVADWHRTVAAAQMLPAPSLLRRHRPLPGRGGRSPCSRSARE